MTPLEISGSLNLIGYGLATIGPGLGVAWMFAAAVQGISRQPEARKAIMSPVFIGFGIVEALAVLGFVLAFIK